MSNNPEEEKSEETMDTPEAALTEKSKDIGFWKEIIHQARLVWYLLKDPDVPFYLKLLPLAAVIYVFIPTDLIPDFFPPFGQLDDITALLVGAKVFIEMAPPQIVHYYLQIMRREGKGGDEELDDAIIIEGDFTSDKE